MKTLLISTLIISMWAYFFRPELLGLHDRCQTQRLKMRSQYLQQRRDRVVKLMQLMISEGNQVKYTQAYYLLRIIDAELHALHQPKNFNLN